jgi:hypothetical protein
MFGRSPAVLVAQVHRRRCRRAPCGRRARRARARPSSASTSPTGARSTIPTFLSSASGRPLRVAETSGAWAVSGGGAFASGFAGAGGFLASGVCGAVSGFAGSAIVTAGCAISAIAASHANPRSIVVGSDIVGNLEGKQGEELALQVVGEHVDGGCAATTLS